MNLFVMSLDNIKKLKARIQVGGCLLLFYLLESMLLKLNILQCPLYKIVGLPCPTCGATRATNSLFEGDIKGALAYNPAIILIYVVIVVFILSPILDKKMSKWILVITCSLILLSYIVCMLFIFPNGEVYKINTQSLLYQLLY